MANEIAKPMYDPFQVYADQVVQQRIVGNLLKFTKFGEWVSGQEQSEVEQGRQLIVYTPSFTTGWICWRDNKPVEQIMAAAKDIKLETEEQVAAYVNTYTNTKLARDALGDLDEEQWEKQDDGSPRDPWQFANYCVFADPETDELFTYAPSSKGGLTALGLVLREWNNNKKQAPDELPIVELGMDSYMHGNRQFGEIRVPILKVVGFTAELPACLQHLASGGNGSAAPKKVAAKPQQKQLPKPPAKAAPAKGKKPAPKSGRGVRF